jgi:hypothetical protein
VKKEQNGRESLRRLKPIEGCNASSRRRRNRKKQPMIKCIDIQIKPGT